MVKDKTLTEDIIQEVYIKVLRAHDSFRGESSEKTWLFSIARHTTMDYFRKQQRKRQQIVDFFNWDKSDPQLKDEASLPEEVVILDDEMQTIYKQLDQCSTDQKNVIILRYIQSFSIQETAEIMNCSTSKVKTTQHRALKKLQELMRASNIERGE